MFQVSAKSLFQDLHGLGFLGYIVSRGLIDMAFFAWLFFLRGGG